MKSRLEPLPVFYARPTYRQTNSSRPCDLDARPRSQQDYLQERLVPVAVNLSRMLVIFSQAGFKNYPGLKVENWISHH